MQAVGTERGRELEQQRTQVLAERLDGAVAEAVGAAREADVGAGARLVAEGDVVRLGAAFGGDESQEDHESPGDFVNGVLTSFGGDLGLGTKSPLPPLGKGVKTPR